MPMQPPSVDRGIQRAQLLLRSSIIHSVVAAQSRRDRYKFIPPSKLNFGTNVKDLDTIILISLLLRSVVLSVEQGT